MATAMKEATVTAFRGKERELRELSRRFRESMAYQMAALCKELVEDDEFLDQFGGIRRKAEEHIDHNYLRDFGFKCFQLVILVYAFPDSKDWIEKPVLVLYNQYISEKEAKLRDESQPAMIEKRERESKKNEEIATSYTPEEIAEMPVGSVVPATEDEVESFKAVTKPLNKRTREFVDECARIYVLMRSGEVDFTNKKAVAALRRLRDRVNKKLTEIE